MRKTLLIAAVAALSTLGLAACSSGQQGATSSAPVTRPSASAVAEAMKACLAKHPKPSTPAVSGTAAAAAAADTTDDCAHATVAATTWQPYLQQIVGANMAGISNAPYAYFVPSSKDPENAGAISRVQDQINGVVAATVLPGNLIAAGGPDSATTAQMLETAFKDASPGSFKGVSVLFIGDKSDEAAVKAALAPSGATFKFAQM